MAVELDVNGHAVDYLLAAYTEKYFGDALLREAKDTMYSPLLFKGVAVPARFNFGYEFRQELTVAMSSFTAFRNRLLEVSGGRPVFKYQPVMKDDLDLPLEFIRQSVPVYPDGFILAVGKTDFVMVSFFIDEDGRVRIPNVDSASSPRLIPNAIKTVHYWQFKPPFRKGKPALVLAAYALSFIQPGKQLSNWIDRTGAWAAFVTESIAARGGSSETTKIMSYMATKFSRGLTMVLEIHPRQLFPVSASALLNDRVQPDIRKENFRPVSHCSA